MSERVVNRGRDRVSEKWRIGEGAVYERVANRGRESV